MIKAKVSIRLSGIQVGPAAHEGAAFWVSEILTSLPKGTGQFTNIFGEIAKNPARIAKQQSIR